MVLNKMIKKGDCLIILFFAAVSLFLTFGLFRGSLAEERFVKIYSDNELYAEYSLESIKNDFSVDIKDMKICISKGGVCVKASNCRDGLCLKQGCINKINQTIVCVPNRVLIEIVSKKESGDVDAVAY